MQQAHAADPCSRPPRHYRIKIERSFFAANSDPCICSWILILKELDLFVCLGFFLFFVFLLLFFRDRVSLCSPGCSGTLSEHQAGLELRNPPASASQSAGITGVRHHCPADFFLLGGLSCKSKPQMCFWGTWKDKTSWCHVARCR